jgi:hypothetical protein
MLPGARVPQQQQPVSQAADADLRRVNVQWNGVAIA